MFSNVDFFLCLRMPKAANTVRRTELQPKAANFARYYNKPMESNGSDCGSMVRLSVVGMCFLI